MVQGWGSNNTRVLTYISPFFSDPSNFSHPSNNFYQQGIDNGYFVKRADGTAYLIQSLSITFAMLDPTNPQAVEWMKNMIVDETLVAAGSSGFMCDFGEYLPFDSVLFSGEDPASFHNKFPEFWAKIAHDAVAQAGRLDDVVFFMRSSWTKSPASTPLFWLGDQVICVLWNRVQ